MFLSLGMELFPLTLDEGSLFVLPLERLLAKQSVPCLNFLAAGGLIEHTCLYNLIIISHQIYTKQLPLALLGALLLILSQIP